MKMWSQNSFGPPRWLKKWRFCLPPLMFWACPVEATARGSKREGKLQPVKWSWQRAPNPLPPHYFRSGGWSFFQGFPCKSSAKLSWKVVMFQVKENDCVKFKSSETKNIWFEWKCFRIVHNRDLRGFSRQIWSRVFSSKSNRYWIPRTFFLSEKYWNIPIPSLVKVSGRDTVPSQGTAGPTPP